ncbi:ESX secretion-associated protein EspG [Amycolatopsis nigrescens]|uniref:ESX secretion-associated protein EspG n=1 Tax=Amycolatopsis nigrescens TaxID=381445 RepID=UPI00036B9F0A|nr:ESX secretion-associated protein EspG [Amycolatopsis nigrescens]
MHQRTILVPKLAFLTAWEWEGHGRPPAVIGMNDLYLQPETKRQLEDKVLDVLTNLGLAAGGMLTREFRDTIAVLAKGGRRFTGWAGNIETGETGGILVSVHEQQAARLLRDDKVLRIDPIPPDRAAESLVDALPGFPPAAFNPVTIEKSSYSPQRKRSETFDFNQPTGYGRPDPAEQIRNLMSAKRSGSHQFYAATGDRRSAPLTVLDLTGRGRVLTFQTERPGAPATIHCLPGSRQNLLEKLHSLA